MQLLLEPPIFRVRERSSATGPPQAECEAPSATSASQSRSSPHFFEAWQSSNCDAL